ncbi:MAG: DUF6765 family protein [Rhodospirillales bacterium]
MQIDMHYYGTYAMARAAGVKPEIAMKIATSAQFVDDNNSAPTTVEMKDGLRVDVEATAHHAINLRNFLDPKDQRQVWLPFHFLPGNIGDNYKERLKCRKDSPVAQDMVAHYLNHYAGRDFAPELMGVAAHVYADTFSHYGFSGVSSRSNKIDAGSFKFHEEAEGIDRPVDNLEQGEKARILSKMGTFMSRPADENGVGIANMASIIGEVGYLGHGPAATFPDRPYLVWSFQYEDRPDAVCDGHLSPRDNPATFLEGCEALHGMFTKFAQAHTEFSANDARPFEDIRGAVQEVLAVQEPKEGRMNAWRAAATEKKALFGPTTGEAIPDYAGGEELNAMWESLEDADSMEDVKQSPIWHFYQAASIHRTYVLRDLLPRHGLIVG